MPATIAATTTAAHAAETYSQGLDGPRRLGDGALGATVPTTGIKHRSPLWPYLLLPAVLSLVVASGPLHSWYGSDLSEMVAYVGCGLLNVALVALLMLTLRRRADRLETQDLVNA